MRNAWRHVPERWDQLVVFLNVYHAEPGLSCVLVTMNVHDRVLVMIGMLHGLSNSIGANKCSHLEALKIVRVLDCSILSGDQTNPFRTTSFATKQEADALDCKLVRPIQIPMNALPKKTARAEKMDHRNAAKWLTSMESNG